MLHRYITQAIVNNFVPLLFVTFQKQFGIALDKIGLLISVNFGSSFWWIFWRPDWWRRSEREKR